MSVKEKTKHILVELKGHAPFTMLGAFLGIVFMLAFRNVGATGSGALFAVFHPSHVVLSAMVTASMFKVHAAKKHFVFMLIVGYLGSVGIATLSDIIIPHIGSELLGLNAPAHAELHRHEAPSQVGDSPSNAHEDHEGSEHEERREHKIHLGFIEEWYLVNPAAIFGVLIAYLLPHTKFPHAGHVLISTWASSSYMLMNIQSDITIAAAFGIFATLFLATWLPCCISDIIFPLLFVGSDVELAGPCPVHSRHSHPHICKEEESQER